MILRFAILSVLLAGLPALLSAPRAAAAEIGSICRLQGAEAVTVSGIGVVTGLSGTGDKANAAKILMQKYMEVLRYDLSLEDLSTKNIALVEVSAEIPPLSRIGDRVRLRVTSIGDASSLKDGALLACVLSTYTGGPAVIRAEGRISTGDTPTTGIIAQGGQLLDSTLINRAVVDKNGIFRLILDRANYGNAATIAQNVNSDQRTNPAQGPVYGFPDGNAPVQIVARARDAKEVIVRIPEAFRNRQVEYISVVLGLDIPLTAEAIININKQSGVVTVSGDVKVMPGFISYRGRNVTLGPTQTTDGVNTVAAAYNLDNDTPRPLVDVFGPYESGGVGRRSLQSLVDSLSAMRCSTDDIIEILKELKESGLIQAKLDIK